VSAVAEPVIGRILASHPLTVRSADRARDLDRHRVGDDVSHRRGLLDVAAQLVELLLAGVAGLGSAANPDRGEPGPWALPDADEVAEVEIALDVVGKRLRLVAQGRGVGLAGDIVERAKRPGRQQRIADPQQAPGIGRVPPANRRTSADLPIPASPDTSTAPAACRGDPGQRPGQLVHHVGTLQQARCGRGAV
jgi:hypothetical protein